MEARISGLVGREAETAEVRRLVEAAVAGAGQSAFIVGEAGLGKTSVLEEGMGTARRLGMRARSGAAQDRERQLPFAAIAGCLGADAASSDGLRSRVAEIVQGHERRGIPGALGGGGEADFAGMEALLGLVEELCAREPLALFFDNLQWADPASLEVVRRLMRSVHQLPLLLVGAYRPDHLCEVDRLVRGAALGRHTVLELAPLSPFAASALLTEQCGGAPGPRLWSMAQGAAGNPMYLTELAAALLREKAIEVHDGVAESLCDLPVPPLKTLITHRLRHLRDDVLQALRVAAVLGADCTVTDLAAVLDRPAHEVLSIVSEAAGSGILCEVGSHLVFRHALVRHALYEALPGSTRAMLHLRAAQVLAGTGATPERVAGHLLAEAPEAGGFLTSWLMESAAALTSRAPALVIRLTDRALALTGPGDPRRGGLQRHRALAQLTLGELAAAEETARCALLEPGAAEWEWALRWIVVQAAFYRGRPDLALAEAQAVQGSEGVPATESTRFRAVSAMCLLSLGRRREAERVAEAAHREARGDAPTLANALHVLSGARFLEAPGPEALELAQQAIRFAARSYHPAERFRLQLTLASGYTELDRGPEAQRTLAAVHEATERAGGMFLPWYHLASALLAFNTGRWDDALTEVEAGLDPGEHFAMSRALRSVAALIAVHRGQRSDAAAHLTAVDAASDTGTVAWFYEHLPLCARALADEAGGASEQAYSRLAHAFDNGIGHLPSRRILGFLTPDLVRLALSRGETAEAQRFTAAARARADHSAVPHHIGDAYRCQGLLDQDPDLLLEAARCYHEAPRPLSEAHAHTDAAELLAGRRHPAQARVVLDQALAIYTRLGADWDAARAAARLRAVAVHRGVRGTRSGHRHGWDALTETERIVASHVAGGRSNPEIATLMSISRRTVSTHVSHILKKLTLASRVEIAAEFIRRTSQGR
ncbi:helix-turn-helix transcriptional regulator [Streptomyces platensis]|uniref:HTH-type transcriptional regulator n=1 Tax=Streptomyces platensis TaxID=58346 RepID=A0AAE6NG61_STRPT|nr:AAA family ATPase [Streptomyces platensis]OSY41981.1 putative HTH-type transcriptional regulator [Streptomyces platensis]QEV51325.1 helix-turn-helix transcriptional regulator [Streptomyces platensis]